eukprot:CAMPEP_0167791738 /NCGR_PEP_ID=MMETSP0111_2-20121227/12117_1 /TAXON_ID=91324 /ORGANISM="Lotharella globosa, Strain CCCM811" /LENGTH=255 /DNA_ID=CAMNT_0007684469 /DNA_START=21 /DNA_END=788 /DNA_ORIENTATION=+
MADKSEHKDIVTGKLSKLADKFDGFQEALNARQTKKVEELDKRFDAVHRGLAGLDHSLKLESKNNKESMTALQAWLENRFKEFHKSIVEPMHENFKKVHERCDRIEAHIERVEKQHAEDHKAVNLSIQNTAQEFEQKLNDFKRKFDEAMQGIEENRKQVELKLVEQERSLVNQLKDEKDAREKNEKHLTERCDAEEKVRGKGIKILTQSMEETKVLLTSKLNEEASNRQQADEQLVKGLTTYSRALQEAVKKLAD